MSKSMRAARLYIFLISSCVACLPVNQSPGPDEVPEEFNKPPAIHQQMIERAGSVPWIGVSAPARSVAAVLPNLPPIRLADLAANLSLKELSFLRMVVLVNNSQITASFRALRASDAEAVQMLAKSLIRAHIIANAAALSLLPVNSIEQVTADVSQTWDTEGLSPEASLSETDLANLEIQALNIRMKAFEYPVQMASPDHVIAVYLQAMLLSHQVALEIAGAAIPHLNNEQVLVFANNFVTLLKTHYGAALVPLAH